MRASPRAGRRGGLSCADFERRWPAAATLLLNKLSTDLMSRLIAKILLTILLFPLAAVAYIVLFVVIQSRPGIDEGGASLWAGLLVWGFLGIYWWLLWRKSVRWTGTRLWLTAGAVLVAALAGVIVWAAVGMAIEIGRAHV